LLVSVHDRKSLSAAISTIFEKRAEGAPDDQPPRAFPSIENIHGYLRACEDQTSEFDWSMLLCAVAASLDLPELAK
jgi:hypothetical protein